MAVRFIPRAIRSETGATAIEYAIIGALIGIGLVGSLLGTKGSLSAVFGTAATQMASSGAGGATPATQPVFNYPAKTVSQRQIFTPQQLGRTDGVSTYEDHFTDGSSMTWAPASSTLPEQMSFVDRAQSYPQTYYYNAALPSKNQPESLTITGIPVNGMRTDVTAQFGSDGSAVLTYQTINTTTGQSTYATGTGQRSDFLYVINQLPFARNLPNL